MEIFRGNVLLRLTHKIAKSGTILSIIFGALIYIVLIFALKILRKEDIMMIPFGSKIYSVLIKLKIYKEEN